VTIAGSGRSSKRSARKRTEFKLKPVDEAIPAGGVATLKLKPSRKRAKQLKKAVALGAKARAVVKVSAVDTARNTATEKRTVKLKR
jgi:hypothetical protein